MAGPQPDLDPQADVAGAPRADLGMVGLGVMGRNFALNLADRGYVVAGFDRDPAKLEALRAAAGARDVATAGSPAELVALLRAPRAVMLLVPAGAAVDQLIAELTPHLAPGDVLIDGGNAYFADTDRRAHALAEAGIEFLGVGLSGGEQGARQGPSIMAGGSAAAYARVRPMFEAAAAEVADEPCVAYLGPGSAGHFVKMVHNGIEYGLMQLIAESYDLMKRGIGLTDPELQGVFTAWDAAELNGYLMEVTAHILTRTDDASGRRLVDVIRDAAEQHGTGRWTSQTAMALGVPVPTIDMAVAMRNLSAAGAQRDLAAAAYRRKLRPYEGNREAILANLRSALYLAMLITYAQGMALLASASPAYAYHLDLRAVARIWRGGCIIRSRLLEELLGTLSDTPEAPNLLFTEAVATKVKSHEWALRRLVCTSAELGVPAPAFMTALGYLDAFTTGWLPANLIQAQRDYFGAHGYARIDRDGRFHTRWQDDAASAEGLS